MKTFSVKNFEKFQHYKDRAPPWIKLYNGLLEDYEFGGLPDASKMHLIAIWLLASRSDNKIPFDAKWVSNRINATEPVDLALLAKRGFIIVDQEEEHSYSNSLAECLTREEGQDQHIEKRKEELSSASRSRNDDFENLKKVYPRRKGNYGWKAAERKFNSLVKTGVDPKLILAAAVRLAETLAAWAFRRCRDSGRVWWIRRAAACGTSRRRERPRLHDSRHGTRSRRQRGECDQHLYGAARLATLTGH